MRNVGLWHEPPLWLCIHRMTANADRHLRSQKLGADKPPLMRWTAPHKASKCRRVIVDDGWDRDRARLAVGEGFPFPLFRLRDGVTVSPWRTFLDAPL